MDNVLTLPKPEHKSEKNHSVVLRFKKLNFMENNNKRLQVENTPGDNHRVFLFLFFFLLLYCNYIANNIHKYFFIYILFYIIFFFCDNLNSLIIVKIIMIISIQFFQIVHFIFCNCLLNKIIFLIKILNFKLKYYVKMKIV